MTLDQTLQTFGFWTSATPKGYAQSVEFLASGKTPGVLQPGESVTVPVYYAGWLTTLWDFSNTAVEFRLAALTTETTIAIDWPATKDAVRPPGISVAAWNGIFPNLVAQLGNTWGTEIQRLDQDAAYLSSLGEKVTDLAQLWSFEVQQANGISPLETLGSAIDLSVVASAFRSRSAARLGPASSGGT